MPIRCMFDDKNNANILEKNFLYNVSMIKFNNRRYEGNCFNLNGHDSQIANLKEADDWDWLYIVIVQ